RHVLHGVDREIDAAVQQRLLDLLGEQALAADLLQLSVLHPVARGADDRDLRGRQVGMCRGQTLLHLARLGQRHGAAAGADPQGLDARHDARCSIPRSGGPRTSWLTRAHARLTAGDKAPISAGMIVLGIETSCDETAAALVSADKCVLAEAVLS